MNAREFYLSLAGAVILGGLAIWLFGCATRIESKPPTLTVVWGNSKVCTDHESDCLEGGTVSESFAKWLGTVVKAAASLLPGNAQPAEVTVNTPECK